MRFWNNNNRVRSVKLLETHIIKKKKVLGASNPKGPVYQIYLCLKFTVGISDLFMLKSTVGISDLFMFGIYSWYIRFIYV
jgi:hypothetical protein